MSKYVKLIDYLDRPEMIRHVGDREIVCIEHDHRAHDRVKMKVTFVNGVDYYCEDGRYIEDDEHSSFVLKEDAAESEPKPLFNPHQKEIKFTTGTKTVEVPLFLVDRIQIEGDKAIITLKGEVK